jgi:hypothetical protein
MANFLPKQTITGPSRTVPRLLAYPLLIVVPIVCIYAGIRLGAAGVASGLMVSSQTGTPVENWTLSLIALAIALFTYVSWAYGNRTLRVRPIAFALVSIYIVNIFVFGAWGLYGFGFLILVLCLVLYIRAKCALP